MIIKMIRERMNTIAKPMVIWSRFFSMMLVPVWEEYSELAIASDMPVPLPECSMMKTIKPAPDITSAMITIASNGFKTFSFFV